MTDVYVILITSNSTQVWVYPHKSGQLNKNWYYHFIVHTTWSCSGHARLQLRYRLGHLVTGDWTGSETQSLKKETAYETNFHRTRIDVHICEFKAFNIHIFAVKIFITLKYDRCPTYTTLIVPLFPRIMNLFPTWLRHHSRSQLTHLEMHAPHTRLILVLIGQVS